MESPPKRVTRSRAAKTSANEAICPKPTRIVTAAAKAKSTTTTATASRTTSTKRKTRADEQEDEAPNTRATRARGRPKKVTAEQEQGQEHDEEPQAASSAAAARPTRSTRAKKTTAEPKAEPVRATRGRGRKATTTTTQQDEEPETADSEPAKKTTAPRSRATGATKSSIKKTVTFEEPEKENIIPTAKAKAAEKPSTGLRARPVRKAASTATKAIRGTKASAAEKAAPKTPLSPKKITQMRARNQDPMSDDELALSDTSPMRKSPIKTSIFLGTPHKSENRPPSRGQATISNATTLDASEANDASVALGSPARRAAPSPERDTMRSPAKRLEGVSLLPTASAKESQTSGGMTPFKASLLQSPAKRCASAMKAMAPPPSARPEASQTPFRTSLLQTPAKRPMSAFKGFPSIKRDAAETQNSPATRPAILSTPTTHTKASGMLLDGGEAEGVSGEMPQDVFAEPPPSLKFPGRLSAVLPRDADPALKEMSVLEETGEDGLDLVHNHQVEQSSPKEAESEQPQQVDEMVVEPAEEVAAEAVQPAEEEDHEMTDPDEPAQTAEQEETAAASHSEPPSPTDTTTPPNSPPKPTGMFALREKDLHPCQDFYEESEDELAGSMYGGAARHSPATPTPGRSMKTPGSRAAKSSRLSNVGFTPLAAQFGAWSATSPVKKAQQVPEEMATPSAEENARTSYAQSAKPSFFDDEMSVRAGEDINAEIEAAIEADIAAQMGEPVFEDLEMTQEDADLAAEANEMSLMESEQLAEMGAMPDHDDSVSDASQDYGDENQVPIDPALFGRGDMTTVVPPVTPDRMLTRTFHTVSKVPLKPADDSTPRSVKKRSNSISRLPVQRPTGGLTRNATVISYSPTKQKQRQQDYAQSENQGASCPATPAKSEKSDIWSTLGTPNRTPRRDVDPALLRGAVVYVDVHTSEGADASGIFVELLGQMGARCVKSWSWSGNDSSKIGITHVVYKDGGKRTLEKVRDSAGVVQCVGVTWVLDCERENKWLDEAPYYIDTSFVPRGGARRRKSMEPKALANLNGAVVSSPVKQSQSRESQTAPNTPFNRRDSYAWVRTPPDQQQEDAEGEDDDDWAQCMLTPVPRTPAPEDIRRMIEDMTPETPTVAMDLANEDLMMRTCPPKQASNPYQDLGEGILSPEKDQSVMMRLMAARRKSLQFAPKVASPLSKTWTKAQESV